MSLDNIQLPPFILQELYKKSLVGLDTIQQDIAVEKNAIVFLGNNKSLITIVVSNEDAIYLPDEQLSFLLGILSACKLNMEDVAIVNIKKNKQLSYKEIAQGLKAEKVFLFGVETAQIELPLQIPHYQVQKYNKQVYLTSPLLNIVQQDKAEKAKLWVCLKEIFLIK